MSLLVLLWLSFRLIAGQPQTDECGSWVALSGSCYLFSDFQVPWGDAVAVCKAFDSNLVDITSIEENLLLEGYLQTKHPHDVDKTHADYWTGGNDIEKEGDFTWIGSHERFTFTNWMTGQPDPSEQDCVEMKGLSNFSWHDETCSHLHYFICEKRATFSGEVIG